MLQNSKEKYVNPYSINNHPLLVIDLKGYNKCEKQS